MDNIFREKFSHNTVLNFFVSINNMKNSFFRALHTLVASQAVGNPSNLNVSSEKYHHTSILSKTKQSSYFRTRDDTRIFHIRNSRVFSRIFAKFCEISQIMHSISISKLSTQKHHTSVCLRKFSAFESKN